jgi:hypothetical protein
VTVDKVDIFMTCYFAALIIIGIVAMIFGRGTSEKTSGGHRP